MIDPSDITNYNLTASELEEHILFWICAAGKNGTTAARCLDKLLNLINGKAEPFESIRKVHINYLPILMKDVGIGCHSHKSKSFKQLAHSDINLRTCTTDELEKIYGIGMKTSRCFIMHTRKDSACAGLDTHMLKNLRAEGVENVPKNTPSSKKEYKRLELEVLKLAEKVGMSPTDYDLFVWNKYKVRIKT